MAYRILILFLASACAKKPVVKQGPDAQSKGPVLPAAGAGALNASAPLVDVSEASIRGTEFAAAVELKTIEFDYDTYSLSDAARAELQRNAEYLKAHPDLEILFELMTDFDEGFQEWRYRHIKLVERTIGNKHGTGGTLGVEFLKQSLFLPIFQISTLVAK